MLEAGKLFEGDFGETRDKPETKWKYPETL